MEKFKLSQQQRRKGTRNGKGKKEEMIEEKQ